MLVKGDTGHHELNLPAPYNEILDYLADVTDFNIPGTKTPTLVMKTSMPA